MHIALNVTPEQIDRYKVIGSAEYSVLGHDQPDVVAVLENPDFNSALGKAIKLNIPVVVIVNKDSSEQQKALSMGIHPDGVIFYNTGKICSKTRMFAEAEGVTVTLLEEICHYAIEKRLYPEIYVWKPKTEEIVHDFKSKKTDRADSKPEKSEKPEFRPGRLEKPEFTRSEKPDVKSQTYSPVQSSLEQFLDIQNNIIAVIRSSPDADGRIVAKEIADALGVMYLDIASAVPEDSDINYAHSDGRDVTYNSAFIPKAQFIVVEITPDMGDVLQTVYDRAYKVVHVVNNNPESLTGAKAWADSGFNLDAVIPDGTIDVGRIKKDIKQACSAVEFLQMLR